MRTTVVVFDSLGHQAELVGRLGRTWRCDCRASATQFGRGRGWRALWLHLRVAPRL